MEVTGAKRMQESFCFTFGCGSPLAKYYVKISAKDEMHARLHMNCLFSMHWAGCYPSEGFDQQIAEYGLLRLHVHYDADVRLGTNHDPIPQDQYAAVWGAS